MDEPAADDARIRMLLGAVEQRLRRHPGAMTVSGLRKSSHWPVAASAPVAHPAANPPLACRSMTFVPRDGAGRGHGAVAGSVVHDDHFHGMPGAAWPTALRQAPMSASLR